MAIGLRFDKGASEGTADQSREDFAVGDVCTIVATGVVGTATFQILAPPPGSTAALVVVDPLKQSITIDVAGRWDIRVGDTADGSRTERTFAAPTLRRALIAPAHNERASADANAADVDPGTWVSESHSNLGGRFTGHAPDLQKVVEAVDGSAEVETGWVSGLETTVSLTSPTTKYDVSAGYISVKGIPTPVAAGPFLDVDPLNLATEGFTVQMVSSAGELVQINRGSFATERRTHAVIQTVRHIGGVIQDVDNTMFLSKHAVEALSDYANENGPINSGNAYTAASNDLTVKKSVGLTHVYMLSGAISTTDPNGQPNAAVDPVVFLYVIRDGAGDFTLVPALSVPVGSWDNNTGALSATPKFVNYRFVFFNNLTGVIVGQTTYDTLAEAQSSAALEAPEIPGAIVDIRNSLRTILSAKGDVTDLSSDVDMRFIQVSPSTPGGAP